MTFQQIHPPGARGKFRDSLMTEPNWIAEEKYDGDRRICQILSEGVRFTGRRVSKKDGLLVEKTENLPHLNGSVFYTDFSPVPASLVGTVLDGEIVCADPKARSRDVTSIMGSKPDEAIRKQQERGWLQYAVFDVLFYKWQDVREMPWHARRIMLDHVMAEWGNPYAFQVPFRTDRTALLEEVWARGGEGVILKHEHSLYGDESAWVKVKREETYDVVVMGFDLAKEESTKVDGSTSITKYAGMVGAVRFGQYKRTRTASTWDADGKVEKGELVECGKCSGFDDATRLAMTVAPTAYLGRAFEISAQQREPSGYFRHPRFKQWRDDKNATDCVWGQS